MLTYSSLSLVASDCAASRDFAQVAAGVGIAAALNFVAARQFGRQIRLEPRGRDADAFQQIGDEAVGLADEGERQMFAVHFLMRMVAREALRRLQSFLRFLGEFFRLHTLRM